MLNGSEQLIPPQELELRPENRGLLEEKIFTTSRQQPPNLTSVPDTELKPTISGIVNTLFDLQEIAEKNPHPQIEEDTDIVWEITGAGSFSKSFPDKKDRYKGLPWTRKMDRARLRVSASIVRQITALRTGKSVFEVTDKDIIEHGPNLVYTGTPSESKHLEEVYKVHIRDYKLVPREKVFMYDQVKNSDGTTRDSYDTVDGVLCFESPNGTKPRRIVIVSHVQHLARVLYVLEKFKEKIPQETVLQVYPLKTPLEGEFEYAVMEARGILAGIYRTGKAARKPHAYEK